LIFIVIFLFLGKGYARSHKPQRIFFSTLEKKENIHSISRHKTKFFLEENKVTAQPKLAHIFQTSNVWLNLIALGLLLLPLGIVPSVALSTVAVIVAIDAIAEIVKLFVIKADTNPEKAKIQGATRAASIMLNIVALGLLLLPLGIAQSTLFTIVAIVIGIDFIVEMVELVIMK